MDILRSISRGVSAVLPLFLSLACAEIHAHEDRKPAPAIPQEYQEELRILNEQMDSFHRMIPPPLTSEHAQIHFKAGVIYFKSGDFKQAEDHLTRSSLMAPDNPDAHLYLARIFGATDRNNEAIDEYKTALQLDPKRIELNKELGDLYRRLGMTQAAEAAYQRYKDGITTEHPH